MFSGAKNEVSEIEDCRAEIPKQSSFPLSETTVSVQDFCEFIRTEKFYAKSLAKWAELYYNITVLFFGKEAIAVCRIRRKRRNGIWVS